MKKLNHNPLKKKQIFLTGIILSVCLLILPGITGCSNKTVQFLEAELEKEEMEQGISEGASVTGTSATEDGADVTDTQSTTSGADMTDTQATAGGADVADKQVTTDDVDVADKRVTADDVDVINAQTETDTSAVIEAQMVYVYVCGAVQNPGVYEMESGSRVFQAVELAGGLLDEAVPEYVNQAMTVADGQQIYIPSREEIEQGKFAESGFDFSSVAGTADSTGAVFSDNGGNGADTSSDKVNINTADKTELMTISGIGESRAQDIIAYREAHGGFSTIEEIMNVPGIKEATFEKIKDGIEVK